MELLSPGFIIGGQRCLSFCWPGSIPAVTVSWSRRRNFCLDGLHWMEIKLLAARMSEMVYRFRNWNLSLLWCMCLRSNGYCNSRRWRGFQTSWQQNFFLLGSSVWCCLTSSTNETFVSFVSGVWVGGHWQGTKCYLFWCGCLRWLSAAGQCDSGLFQCRGVWKLAANETSEILLSFSVGDGT